MDKSADRPIAERIRLAATDASLVARRAELARLTAETFSAVGKELHVVGHVLGTDRVDGVSPGGHGTDEVVAASLLLRMAAQLVSASAELFLGGRSYAAAALLRQIVEIEYLAWALESGDREGQRWLRSDRRERESFFSPRKLRQAAQGKFRGVDYGYHCELGGHPVPRGSTLLGADPALAQLLLADLLGHAGRIWDHMVGWARRNEHEQAIAGHIQLISQEYVAWKSLDPLAQLPPPEIDRS